MKEYSKIENDYRTEQDWNQASVTFNPEQTSSRRMSTELERKTSIVTFDPNSSSRHGNKTRSERRGSNIKLDASYHDNIPSERPKSTVALDDDPLNSNRDNTQTSHNKRPLTSESSKISVQQVSGDETLLLGNNNDKQNDETKNDKDNGSGDFHQSHEMYVALQQTELIHNI